MKSISLKSDGNPVNTVITIDDEEFKGCVIDIKFHQTGDSLGILTLEIRLIPGLDNVEVILDKFLDQTVKVNFNFGGALKDQIQWRLYLLKRKLRRRFK